MLASPFQSDEGSTSLPNVKQNLSLDVVLNCIQMCHYAFIFWLDIWSKLLGWIIDTSYWMSALGHQPLCSEGHQCEFKKKTEIVVKSGR